jgi:predicted nucleic acid-binding protein
MTGSTQRSFAALPRPVSPYRSYCGKRRPVSPPALAWLSGWLERVVAHPTLRLKKSSRPSTKYEDRGLMLIVDASCLYEMVVGAERSERVRQRLADDDNAAPHVIDVEVLGTIRRDRMLGRLDATAAAQAVEDLRDWPGERFGHRSLLERAWELRDNVRSWDALYVALAEALDGTLVTLDRRLAGAPGLRCQVEVIG